MKKLLETTYEEFIADDGTSFSLEYKHFILVRDPLAMIPSWQKKFDQRVHDEPCSLQTMGLPTLASIYSAIRQQNKSNSPIVVDSEMLAKDPSSILTRLCYRLQIPFLPSQLQWPQGPKPAIDGRVRLLDSIGFSHNSFYVSIPQALGAALVPERACFLRLPLSTSYSLRARTVERRPSGVVPRGPSLLPATRSQRRGERCSQSRLLAIPGLWQQ